MTTPHQVRDALARTIIGQPEVVDALVMGLLADGHVLLEGMPGVAKTLACRALAAAVGGRFKRVQFTPDLLPSDIIGTRIFDQRSGEFVTVRGPLFANIVLADEINRAPAKVQSALLEGMQERRATIGPDTLDLPRPFAVLATMNPFDADGTYALPLAQLDRFLLNVRVGYPSREDERNDRRTFLGRRRRTRTRRRDAGRRRALATRGARRASQRAGARLRRRSGASDARREVRRLRSQSARGAGAYDPGAARKPISTAARSRCPTTCGNLRPACCVTASPSTTGSRSTAATAMPCWPRIVASIPAP